MHLFWHDLRRLARRGHLALARIVLGLSLLIALTAGYVNSFPNARVTDLSTSYIDDPLRLSAFGKQFTHVIISLQLIVVVAVAPAVCAGAFADERSRGTLDLLRISWVSPAAIVAGKFASRLLYLGSFLLLCLPVLAFSQLWDSVEPRLIAGSFAVIVLTLAAVIAISLFCSVSTTSAPASAAAAYTSVVFLWAVVQYLPWCNPTAIVAPWLVGGGVGFLASVLVYAAVCVLLTAIILYFTSIRLARDGEQPRRGFVPMSGSRAAPPAAVGARLLTPIDATRFAFLFQPLLTLVPRAESLRIFPPPRVRDSPLCWKESYFGGNPAAREWLRTIALTAIIIEALVTGVLLLKLIQYAEVPVGLAWEWNGILRSIVIAALTAAMLSVTAFAAGSIVHERERKTLDALMALPDGRMAVLFSKWLGSLLRARWPIAAIALPLAGGLAVGAFHALTIETLVLALIVQLAFAASLGILCSVVSATTGRSMVVAILVVLAASVVPLLSLNRYPDFLGGSVLHRALEAIGIGLSPVATWLSLLNPAAARSPDLAAVEVLPGLAVYAVAAVMLAGLASWIFVRQKR